MPRSLIGAHVSVAGGLPRCGARAEQVGAEVVQVFVANPRAWAPPRADPDADEAFAVSCAAASLPVFVHAPYLINFGSPSPQTLINSAEALVFSLRRGAAIGARGVVLHAGSAVLGSRRDAALAQTREHLLRALDAVPDAPTLLIEPTAGGGNALASGAASLSDFLDGVGRDPRIGVCLDTCHMHASGHDLSTPARFTTALRQFARAAGSAPIGLVHVNDSRDPAGSLRDRHAGIGTGTIGKDPFRALFTSRDLRGVPFVVETTDEHQARDIAELKSLRVTTEHPPRRI